MSLNHTEIRSQFPQLNHQHNGQPSIFLDGPAGTQQPEYVIKAMTDHMRCYNGVAGAPFPLGQEAGTAVEASRAKMADFLNANEPDEIVFGPNMTTLTLTASRAISHEWQAGDEIIVTRLDHEGNISPWLLAAADKGATVRWLDLDPTTGMMQIEMLDELLSPKTKLVACNYAANALGSITDVQRVTAKAKEVGALVYIDAVHYAPHDSIDVQAIGCDFLVSSPYKYFAPHSGVLWGKKEHLLHFQPYGVRIAPADQTSKWSIGMPAFEIIVGIGAAIDYIASLVPEQPSRRAQLVAAMATIKAYESEISERFLRGVVHVPGVRVYGNTDLERIEERTPTFAVTKDGYSAAELGVALAERGVYLYTGHFYGYESVKRLGLLDDGKDGVARLGFVHYNTLEEVDRLLEILADV